MEPVNNDGMCRCCASEGTFKDLQSTYLWMGIGEVYSDMIKDCFDISLSTSISGNGGICEVCITQLRNACNFKKQVEQTEEQFRRRLADSEFRADVVKIEVPPDVEGHDADNDPFEGTVSGEFSRPANVLKIEVPPDDEDHDADNDPFEGTMSDEFSGPEYDIPLKNIKIEKEIEKPKKRAAKPSTSKAKKPKAEDGEPSVKRTREIKKDQHEKKSKANINLSVDREQVQRRIKLKAIRGSRSGGELHKHYSNAREVLVCTNATPIRQCGDFGYACCYCELQYQDPGELKRHTLDNHVGIENICFAKKPDLCGLLVKLDITGLQCNLCAESIESLDDVFTHLSNVHKRTIHTDIKNQIVPFKFESEQLRCFICLNEFNRFKVLVTHMSAHYRNFVCETCNAGYVTRRQYMAHVKNHDTGSFKCEECDKVFETSIKKNAHAKLVHHKKNLVYKCSFCSEMSRNYRQKLTHMRQVHGIYTKYQCNACDKIFWSQYSLSIHTQRDHLMERRHKCTQCESTFFAATDLKEHMIKHTGERIYQCDVCLKRYGRKWTLREHMRIHANDRRFKCEYCGQAFVQKCSWRGHMRSQHGEDV